MGGNFTAKRTPKKSTQIRVKKSLDFGFRKLVLLYWAKYIGLDLKNAQITLLGSNRFYVILNLDQKSGWTVLLGLDWFYNILEMDLKGGSTAFWMNFMMYWTLT